MTDRPGLYDLPMATYLADPCPEPSLSSSIAAELIERSPRHAWHAHPRLGGARRQHRREFDIGSAAHELVLGVADKTLVLVDAPDYRTKAAQEARDLAHEAGQIPLLAKQWRAVHEMAAAARAQLDQHREAADAFTDGAPERTLIWREGSIWCRARPDWLPKRPDRQPIDDYKTTSTAHPDVWARRCFDLGYDIQAAFYLRGLRAVLGIEPAGFRFVVQEAEPPYCLSVIQLSPGSLDMAMRKVDAAIALWSRCLAENSWPGYPAMTCHIEAPVFAERAWLEREEREGVAKKHGQDLFRLAVDWQAPLPERAA